MNKVVSEDALRRALERIDEAAGSAWLRPSLMHSVRESLDRPWVLDIDASIKPLYGRQEGAQIGYDPTKPMRPSQVLHNFLVSNLRLVLDVQVSSGKQHTTGYAKAALGRLLDELAQGPGGNRRPALVRGDSGYGNEGIPLTLEERKQPDIFKPLIANIGAVLQHVKAAAEQFKDLDSQSCLLRYVSDRITPVIGQSKPATSLPATG